MAVSKATVTKTTTMTITTKTTKTMIPFQLPFLTSIILSFSFFFISYKNLNDEGCCLLPTALTAVKKRIRKVLEREEKEKEEEKKEAEAEGEEEEEEKEEEEEVEEEEEKVEEVE